MPGVEAKAIKRTWRSKNNSTEKCAADRQLQRHEDKNGWTHPRWSELFFAELSLGSKDISNLQDPGRQSRLGWAVVRVVARRDVEQSRIPFDIVRASHKQMSSLPAASN